MARRGSTVTFLRLPASRLACAARDGGSPMAGLPNLKSLAPAALRACLRDEGEAAFRAEQLLEWLYAKGVEDPRAMSNLPAALRERLAAGYATRALETEAVQLSRDGTRKLALRAADGAVIETVVIPEARRTTLCVSTQVGCSLACSFCATGALGLARNLTTAEIVDQVCRAREAVGDDAPITNVVFMGLGEPLANYGAVVRAIRLPVLGLYGERSPVMPTARALHRLCPHYELHRVRHAGHFFPLTRPRRLVNAALRFLATQNGVTTHLEHLFESVDHEHEPEHEHEPASLLTAF